ncbi:MAG TPA: hypothetical protein DCQ06_00545 [Myxococcales bacterium]|nr:hypothetical protein [Myxococcales bacterium]
MSAEDGLRLGLIGTEIASSLSPLLHQRALDYTGIQGEYGLFECASFDQVIALIDEIRLGQIDGLNITKPYKQSVAALMDDFVYWDGHQWLPSEVPLTSVNTVARGNQGQLVGASTDGVGLGLAMQQAGLDLPTGAGVVLGAGGAADALVRWLARIGKTPRWICNRDSAKAERLVRRAGLDLQVVDWVKPDVLKDATWVLQTTSAGHAGQHVEGVASLEHLPWRDWAKHTLIIDIVYSTTYTAAQRCALAHGGKPIGETGAVWLRSGRAMLAGQAALSQSLWTDASAPYAEMLAAISATS